MVVVVVVPVVLVRPYTPSQVASSTLLSPPPRTLLHGLSAPESSPRDSAMGVVFSPAAGAYHSDIVAFLK